MNIEEWRATISSVNRDIANILRAQQVLTEVHDELDSRAANRIEEDFIFVDALGRDPNEPIIKIIDGVEVHTRLLHRRGLQQSDIKGADLLYEIAGRKFVLVQYKSPNKRNRIIKDERQLARLVASCPNPCPPSIVGFWPTCGAWYAIRSVKESFYLPACYATSIFDSAASLPIERFASGLGSDVFDQLFARCWTGARTTPEEYAYLTWAEMEEDRVLFSVLQRGTFGI
jgi:hypothetical protein